MGLEMQQSAIRVRPTNGQYRAGRKMRLLNDLLTAQSGLSWKPQRMTPLRPLCRYWFGSVRAIYDARDHSCELGVHLLVNVWSTRERGLENDLLRRKTAKKVRSGSKEAPFQRLVL